MCKLTKADRETGRFMVLRELEILWSGHKWIPLENDLLSMDSKEFMDPEMAARVQTFYRHLQKEEEK